MNKEKECEKFFTEIIDPESIGDLIIDRVGSEVLVALEIYAKKLAFMYQTLPQINIDEIFTGALVVGYLLKNHLDRAELTEIYKES